MKIGIDTLDSRIYNYGGILQEYALLMYLKQYGEVEIIDYDLESELNTFSLKRSISNFKISKVLERINSKSNNTTLNPKVLDCIRCRHSKFDKFRDDYLNFSNRLKCTQLSDECKKYDYVFCGSDQIWNPDYNKPSFFLNFIQPQKRVIYAASVGKNELSRREKLVYQDLLKDNNHVSVREQDILLLFDDNISVKFKVVLDPTLLLSKEEWSSLLLPETRIKDFIFCYFLNHTEEKIRAVKNFAKSNNKIIVAIPYLHDCPEKETSQYADVELSDIGPREFISLINYADCVITDSFHACVFSLIFNKCFYVFGRKVGKLDMNSRIKTLLGYFDGAECRLIKPCDLQNCLLDDPEEYDKKRLYEKIAESRFFIENSIDSINGSNE